MGASLTAAFVERGRGVVVWGLVAGLLLAGAARGQQANPVYTDDSPVARETLGRVGEFVGSGNDAEAVRELQKLLDEQAERLVAVEGQPDLLISVRSRVHAVLLASPRLLEKYRAAEGARAAQELAGGMPEAVERSRLLTGAGFEAALRVAQTQLEGAGFEAARITLEQLEAHPDRRGASGADAAGLLAQVGRYLGRPEVAERAARWAKEAGAAAPAGGAIEPPASLRAHQTGFFSPAAALETEGVPSKPLWTTPLEPQALPESEAAIVAPDQENFEDLAANLWVLPTVVGDTVYVNDGMFITARDRFTLQPRWVVRPSSVEGEEDPWAARRSAVQGRGAQQVEDTASVTVAGRVVVATTGVAQNGDRDGDPSTSAIDAVTGKVLWSVVVPNLDPQLEGASMRGPALVDGGTVVVAARKSAQGRRIVTAYLVGLSLGTGELKWVRPIASAGSLPFGQREPRVSHAPLLHEGVVYCVDQIGALGAVEAATGRPVWIRRWPVPALGMGGMPFTGMPWQWSAPVAWGDSVFMLAPNRMEVVKVDRAGGAITGRRTASSLGGPSYLLPVGDQLAAVGGESVFFVPAAEFERGNARKTRTFGVSIQGRVVVSGGKLLVPRSDGVAIIDPANPSQDAGNLRLERLGNVLPLESQVLVVDATNLHSYLTWSVAEALLQTRMKEDPADADPAITYADLAYRSGHPDAIVGAVDRALGAIDQAGGTPGAKAARSRLFAVLRDMVEYSQAAWAAPAAPAEPAEGAGGRGEQRPGRRRQATALRPPPVELPRLGVAHMGPIVERMGRAAQTADERVSHLMAQGRLRDAESKAALAAESYQRVLDDRVLAGASWRSGGVSVRAELEATRRLRQLLLERGPAAYAAFEAQAAQELSALGTGATAEALEALARRYPASAVSATAWMHAADLHEAAGRRHATVWALREGLASAEMARAAGVTPDSTVLGEVAGRLVSRLQALEQLFGAARLIARLGREFPDVALTDHGRALDGASLAAELQRRLAALQRLPRIGAEIKPEAQALVGWEIMEPRSREQGGRAAEHVMMINPGESRVALWGVPGAGEAGAAAGTGQHVQMLWSREYKQRRPVLLRLDPESVYLFWDRVEGADGAVIERISAVGGETRWKTEPFRGLFPVDADLNRRVGLLRNVINTPIMERNSPVVRLTDVLVAMDEQVMAVVERSGRAAGFDPESGRMLWRMTTPVSQVYDMDVGAGVVVVGGAAAPEGDRAAIVGLSPLIEVYDARTGQAMHRLDKLAGEVRWLRLSGQADQGATLIAGLGPQVDSVDLSSGKTRWSIPGRVALGSLDGWIFGDRLYLLDSNRTLWTAPLATGRLEDKPLDTFEQLAGAGPIQAQPVGPGLAYTAFMTDRGVSVFDSAGKLVGLDSLEAAAAGDGSLVMPAASEHYFVAVETQMEVTDAGQPVYAVHILDTQSAMLKSTRRLALEMTPRALVVLDGRVLVTAGAHTVVYAAPEGDR